MNYSILMRLFAIKQYIPVMTELEREQLCKGIVSYDDADLARWEHDLKEHEKAQKAYFSAVQKRCLC